MKLMIATLLLFSTPSFAINCFWKDQVINFMGVDNTHLKVDTMGGNYTLEVNYCPELPFAYRIGFDSNMADVCEGDSVLIFDNSSNYITDRCFITNITRN